MRELAISLDAEGSRPLYEQIYSYIKHEIQEGQLLRPRTSQQWQLLGMLRIPPSHSRTASGRSSDTSFRSLFFIYCFWFIVLDKTLLSAS